MPVPKGTAIPAAQRIKDKDFKEMFVSIGPNAMARETGMNLANIFGRRRAIELREGIVLTPPTKGGHVQQLDKHSAAVNIQIQDGHILIGSDSHYWPGVVTTAHRAFLEFAKEFQPKVIIKNGDEADFPQISRHAPIGWEERPKLSVEIDNR